MANKPKGLFTNTLDIDKFIRLNNLKEITNPIFIDKHAPTPDGLLSYEIFGTTTSDRQSRMAYIDLHDHYMTPLAAIKLSSYSRTLDKILQSQEKYKLVKDELIQDDNGETGPEFLYHIWGKVKVPDKDTVTTKEIQKFFEKSRDKLFITKLPVIPAFYRDMNTMTGNFSKSSNEINNIYSSIISYTQTLQMYTDTFSDITALTRTRVQNKIIDVYRMLVIEKVKGNPSKFGMLRRFMQGKNVNYSARMVISAPNYTKNSFNEVITRFGYATIPLTFVCSLFYPFIVYHLKRFFDAQFIQAGKQQIIDADGSIGTVEFQESFDEIYISKMITKFLNDPASRFDKVETPPDTEGKIHNMIITGRFNKENTTISRAATVTDLLYIVAKRATEDKHVMITRYPLDNFNGQFPAKVEISTTTTTQPAIIGETLYNFFPVCKGDPSSMYVNTLQYSNTQLKMQGGDYDGDTVSIRPVFTKEANADCERRINSVAYIVGTAGQNIRPLEKDFALTAYNLTIHNLASVKLTEDCNKAKVKYAV